MYLFIVCSESDTALRISGLSDSQHVKKAIYYYMTTLIKYGILGRRSPL